MKRMHLFVMLLSVLLLIIYAIPYISIGTFVRSFLGLIGFAVTLWLSVVFMEFVLGKYSD